jgi:Ca-activated chloride channel family protein
MFEFAHPFWLLLLLPVAGCAWCVYARRIHHGIRFAPTARFPKQGRSWRTRTAQGLPALYLAALALMAIAMARPRSMLSQSRRTADVIAIQMVIDVSGSMEALDLSTVTPLGPQYRTRLDVVKETFAAFIDKRPDDLIGLISFGGYASTLAPLTADHEALKHVLSGVEIPRQMHDREGQILNQDELLTAIGDALATGCARLRDAEPVSKIIVLLSDGDSNAGIIEPETAIKAARELGIKVYTIGIGSTGRAPVRVTDAFGRQAIQHAWVTFDETLLRKIADDTGGTYYNVRDAKGLDTALESINTLETTKVEQNIYRQYDELFTRFALPALALLLIAVSLNMAIARRIV